MTLSKAVEIHGLCNRPAKKVAVALILNRADWLASIDYTIPEAIERTGPEWLALIPRIARELSEENEH